MNYQEHYDKLVFRARERKLDCYSESHHIIPRCMGGTDDKNNLVQLTAREHFIAHLLLWKIHPKSHGLIKAISMMCAGNKEYRSLNRMYSWLKEYHAKSMSYSQKGEKNSQFGKIWIYNLELKESKPVSKDEFPKYESLGWLKGRKINFNIKQPKPVSDFQVKQIEKRKQLELDNEKKKQQILINKEKKKQQAEEDYILLRKVGFDKFKIITGYAKSAECLMMFLRKHAKNYESRDHRLKAKMEE